MFEQANYAESAATCARISALDPRDYETIFNHARCLSHLGPSRGAEMISVCNQFEAATGYIA